MFQETPRRNFLLQTWKCAQKMHVTVEINAVFGHLQLCHNALCQKTVNDSYLDISTQLNSRTSSYVIISTIKSKLSCPYYFLDYIKFGLTFALITLIFLFCSYWFCSTCWKSISVDFLSIFSNCYCGKFVHLSVPFLPTTNNLNIRTWASVILHDSS